MQVIIAAFQQRRPNRSESEKAMSRNGGTKATQYECECQ